MKHRLTPKNIPSRWPFVTASVPGFDDPLVFKMPRATRAPELFGGFLDMLRAHVAMEDKTGPEALEAMAEMYAEAAKLVAALWAHPVIELESAEGDADALLDEFHEAGMSENVVLKLASGLVQKQTERAITEQEVASRADFFGGPTPASSMPTSSTSSVSAGSATTEAVEPGMT